MRINIDLKFLADKRVDRLARLCAEEKFTTIGRLIYLYAVCYDKRSPYLSSQEVDLHTDWIGQSRFADLMVDAGLAKPPEKDQKLYFIQGIKDRIKFLLEASDSGKRSAEARREKYGTAQPGAAPTENPPKVPEGTFEDSRRYPEGLPKVVEDLTLTPSPTPNPAPSPHIKERSSIGGDTLRESPPEEDDEQGALLPEEIKPRPKRVTKKMSEVQIFIARYVNSWRERYGDNGSPMDDVVAGQIKNWLKGRNVEEYCLLIQAYLQMDTKIFCDLGHDFVTFTKHVTRIKAALCSGRENPTEEDLADFIRRKEREEANRDSGLLQGTNSAPY